MKLAGKAAENEARKLLEEAGWEVHQARAQLKRLRGFFMTLSNDIWGCIDLAAFCSTSLWFIQVTTTAGVSKRRRKLEQLPWPYHLVRISIFEAREEKVGRRKMGHFRIHDLNPDGWVVKQRLDVPHRSDP
jgi:hypothetical protein